jgi:hypothetical protein
MNLERQAEIHFTVFYSNFIIDTFMCETFLLEVNKNGNLTTTSDSFQLWRENFTFIPDCSYVNRYPLGVYVRICRRKENATLDIRRFRQEDGTTNGIQISKSQWQYLKRSMDHIDFSLLNNSA